jgi:molybdopterin/thiamine biosynthesis adenylyltransferase
VILGLGSIGSSVAELLVKSGVGKMVLIDADILSSENVSRHVLGVESIGSSKAVELALKFTTCYPHIDVTGFKKTAVDIATENLDMLSNADLIVSTIGSWRAEGWLNAFSRRAAKFPPVLYGWTEAHASAGHAVIFFEKDGCLRCLTDGAGRLRIPVTRWPNHDTLLPVPACGGHFQPYGAVELAHIHGLVADLALQTLLGKVNKSKYSVWIGHRSLLDGVSKGEWSPDWIKKYGDPGDGCYVKEVDIVAEPACTECGEQS